ncbi:helix-turn-helix transcriptional regulator [Flavobacteriaceae bacterium]|jgi:transcriptional regulator with XRE-family HTH domain|nr:helix-turn-helix domain-containing protein [Flavobacteriaceae bacterium]MDC0870658.1 helix-turn-helix transcriptional regulator [Flavobacteriaceae bacterium]|tara:strand:- start:336 stop:707 length:372 start_codon:yes stop_codon:yes gene_type:complete
MVNILDFTNRLKKILNYHQLTASLFADKIGVQRSSISHILSGRNKPSLDFILKVTNTFTDVDIYWLLNGKGEFPKEQGPTNKVFSPNESSIIETSNSKSSKKMNRIVVFYEDGTFEEYKKNNY